MTPLIVGFGHRLHTGKDTAAKILIEKYGFTRMSFADELKRDVIRRFPHTLKEIAKVYLTLGITPINGFETLSTNENDSRWDEFIHRLVWIDKPPIVRRLIQNYATEVRRADDPAYWVDIVEDIIISNKLQRVVITDLRFPNEGNWIHRHGGLCLKITRTSAPIIAHESETALEDWLKWDAVIPNEGTIEQLWSHVEILVSTWCKNEELKRKVEKSIASKIISPEILSEKEEK